MGREVCGRGAWVMFWWRARLNKYNRNGLVRRKGGKKIYRRGAQRHRDRRERKEGKSGFPAGARNDDGGHGRAKRKRARYIVPLRETTKRGRTAFETQAKKARPYKGKL